jgi:hypothetical protein
VCKKSATFAIAAIVVAVVPGTALTVVIGSSLTHQAFAKKREVVLHISSQAKAHQSARGAESSDVSVRLPCTMYIKTVCLLRNHQYYRDYITMKP